MSPIAMKRVLVILAMTALDACAGSTPSRGSAQSQSARTDSNAPSATVRDAGLHDAGSSSVAATSSAPPSLADRITDALRPLGPLHRPLVVLNEPSEYIPRVHLAFIGPPDHVDAAWLAFDFAAEGRTPRPGEQPGVHVVRIEGWIAGVRIVDVVRSVSLYRALILVEAVDGADATPGTRGVVSIDGTSLLGSAFTAYTLRRGADWVEMRGVSSVEAFHDAIHLRETRSAAEIEHASRRDVHYPTPDESNRDCARFVRALGTARGWLEFVDPAGLDVARWTLGIVPGAVTHIARDQIVSSHLAEPIRRVLLDEQQHGGSVCRGRRESFLANDYSTSAPPRIQAVMLEPERAPDPSPPHGAFRVVDPVPIPDDARAALRANVEHDLVATLAAPTEHGLLVAGTDGREIMVMLWRGHIGWFQPVLGFPPAAAHLEIAFVQHEGDPRTSVLLRAPIATSETSSDESSSSPPPPEWFHIVVDPRGGPDRLDRLEPDEDSAWWMVGSRDLATATNALTHAPIEPIPRAQVCALLARAANRRTWRTALASDARWIDFEEPGVPTYGRSLPIDASFRVDCGELSCSHDAPHCRAGEGLTERDYWFRREGAAWRLAGVAVYTGS